MHKIPIYSTRRDKRRHLFVRSNLLVVATPQRGGPFEGVNDTNQTMAAAGVGVDVDAVIPTVRDIRSRDARGFTSSPRVQSGGWS